MTMKVEPLSLDLVRTDGGTQLRALLDQVVCADYRDKWLEGFEFDPVDVFHDGAAYWLADGFHRFFGAKDAKRSSIRCRVHQGTQRDAILFAAGANAAHGLRRTNEDKRVAVKTLLNDEEWVTWSDNKIADQAAVSVQFVSLVRKQLSTVDSSPAAKAKDKPRVGRDGKKRQPRKPRNKPSKAEREPGDDPLEARHDPARPTDKSGNALPDRPELLKAFSAGPLFHSTEAARNVIQNNCLEICPLIPDGKEFREKIDKALKGLFHLIESYRPAFVCKSCSGGKCARCGKRGYTTWQTR